MPQALRDVFCMQGGGLNVEGVNSWKKRKNVCEQSRNLVLSAKSQKWDCSNVHVCTTVLGRGHSGLVQSA